VKLVEVLAETALDVVFVPSPVELHPTTGPALALQQVLVAGRCAGAPATARVGGGLRSVPSCD
jgi:hypothetical protein